MTPYYERKEATEWPKDEEYYLTDHGPLRYNATLNGWYDPNGYMRITKPQYYFLPLPSPISSMTLEEAKEKVAQIRGFESYKAHIDPDDYDWYKATDFMEEVAELYLQHNTAHLLEEIEELKQQMRDSLKLYEAQNNTIIKRDQQVKVLREALEIAENELTQLKNKTANNVDMNRLLMIRRTLQTTK